MNIYQNSLLTKLHLDEAGNPISVALSETFMIRERGIVQLSEFPETFQRIQIQKEDGTPYVEMQGTSSLKENEFKVNYANGIVFFHPSQVGTTIHCRYYGRGCELISTNRIFHTNNDEDVPEILHDIVEKGKATVDELEALNGFLNDQELARQTAFDEAMDEVDERLLAEDNDFRKLHARHEAEHQQQMQNQASAFRSQLTNQQQVHQTQMNTHQNEFDSKMDEWDRLVVGLGQINDSSIDSTNTWSSQKIQSELNLKVNQSDVSTQSKANTVVQRDSKGNINAHQFIMDEGRVLTDTDLETTLPVFNNRQQLNVKKGIVFDNQTTLSPSADGLTYQDRQIPLYEAGQILPLQGLNFQQGGLETLVTINQGNKSLSVDSKQVWDNKSFIQESGVWTPNVKIKTSSYIGNATTTNATGRYHRLGNLVYLQCQFNFETSEVGEIIITGIPFSANTQGISSGTIAKYTRALKTNELLFPRISSDGYLKLALYNPTNAFSYTTLSTTAEAKTGGFIFDIWYTV